MKNNKMDANANANIMNSNKNRKNKKKKRLLGEENFAAFLFLLPGLLGFLVFVLAPIFWSFFLSFQDWSFTKGLDQMKFIGLKNFVNLMNDSTFKMAMKNTIIIALTMVPITTVLGLVFAVLIKDFAYGKSAIRTMMFLPYISSLVAISVVFMVMFYPSYGPVNQFLTSVGVANPPKWFADTKWALPSIILLTIWKDIGYYIVVFIAGLTNIPNDLYEAAELDGANAFRRFIHITIPGVSPITFFLVIMGLINSFKIFDQVMVTTGGGPGTSSYVLALYIYETAFGRYNMGYGSAMAWVMFAIVAIITTVQYKVQNNKVRFMM